MARSGYGSSSGPTPLPDYDQRQQERRQPRSSSSAGQRPHRSTVPDSDVTSPLEEVTDVVLASEYYWSPEAWPQPRGRATSPYSASIASTSTRKSGHNANPGRRISPRHGSWGDVNEEQYRLSTPWEPPRTPQLGRLGTPDLELTRKCDKFCDCCSDEQRYNQDRSKMDLQVEAALAHMRGSSGRRLLTSGNDVRRGR
ncbi:hypothetical protein KVR01_000053 [Diaporthe batatas]|uniref:uncharacterized protein n=1 Tax=Diaporthe batatas TaxID=748121 RepID=UPI001D05B143|nr:uncharacterized protein KVR01_000053 [Diaporthe batatas]KAG8169308.1 hypothetical protein KVR01_000053 [Diaporthe batatas]